MGNLYDSILGQVSTTNSTSYTTTSTNFFTRFDVSSVLSKTDASFMSTLDIRDFLWTLWSFVTVTKVLIALLLYTNTINLKNAPGIWTVSVLFGYLLSQC